MEASVNEETPETMAIGEMPTGENMPHERCPRQPLVTERLNAETVGEAVYDAIRQCAVTLRPDFRKAVEAAREEAVSESREAGVLDRILENARIGVENAKLALDSRLQALENYEITAPISGTVIEKNFKAGDNVDSSAVTSAGGNLAVLYDMSTLTFEMKVNELDINNIQVGQEVEITADALEGMTFKGYVDKININGTTANGRTTYPVTVVVEGTPEELKPGMNVSAEVLVEDAGNVLCVPVEAVQRGNTVLVAGQGALDESGNLVDPTKLEERPVTLGRSSSEYIEILDGLEEGETVYVQNIASNAMAMMMGVGG